LKKKPLANGGKFLRSILAAKTCGNGRQLLSDGPSDGFKRSVESKGTQLMKSVVARLSRRIVENA
jgi:hypothetical protein